MKIWRSTLAMDLVFVLVMTAFGGFCVADDLIAKGASFWDNVYLYSLFWNQMDSLNRFAEPAWWFPANQLGWPGYYYTILGDIACASPAAVLIGVFMWITGLLQMHPSIYAAFTFHYAFLSPCLMNLAFYTLSRQLFKNRAAVLLTVLLSAFSPGVITNVSDPGFVEPLAYGLFLLASWIAFLRKPHGSGFWFSALFAAILAATLGFPAILWNAFFIPIALVLAVILPPHGLADFRAALKARPAWQWAVALCGIGLCDLVPIMTYLQTGDLMRSRIGSELYDFRRLMVGNPLEALTVSLPQFGFEWRDYQWTLLPGLKAYNIGVNYVCLLCLPLTIIALLYATRTMRLALVIGMTLFSAAVCLSAWSPLFSLVIRLVKPLQSNNHYSDLGFRCGAFVLFILAAAAGFDILAEGHRRARRAFPWLIGGSLLASVIVYSAIMGDKIFGNTSFGLMVVLSVQMIVFAIWWRRDRMKKFNSSVMAGLMALTLIDVSTFTFLHMRAEVMFIPSMVTARDDVQAKDSVGLEPHGDWQRGDYAEGILMYRPYYNMIAHGFDPKRLPRFDLFSQAHAGKSGDLEAMGRELTAFGPTYQSVVLDEDFANMPEFAPFMSGAPGTKPNGSATVTAQSYNSIELKVKSSEKSLFFLRDAYSPYWKATVNGAGVPIARALFNFKAIPVPAGESEIHLRFSPPGISWSITMAYFVMLAFGIIATRAHFPMLSRSRQ